MHGSVIGGEWQTVRGVVTRGHGVASGPSADYPYGTLEKQIPIFRERGLDLEACFLGTLNLDISPHTFRMLRPRFTFRAVAWTDLHPPEDFSFSPCRLAHQGRGYEGWVYYPHPETKVRHFQKPWLIEIIAKLIAGIEAGDAVELSLRTDEIEVTRGYTT